MTSLGLPEPESLSLTEQVAQLIVVRASGYLFDHQRRYPQWELNQSSLRHCIETLGIGGVILLGGSAAEVGLRSQQLQSWATVPLLLAADIEEGVGQRFAGATQFPPPMALSAIARHHPQSAQDYAYEMGAITAREAIAIGLNWLLAPVVDVNNNIDNPVINVRAFGDTPAQVSQLSTAYIHGAQQLPVLTTAKHFPGHGDTAIDSHLHLPEISHSLERLYQIELVPFRSAIAAGVDTVMTAHLMVPAYDQQWPATLSSQLLTQLLRQQLNFQGLVVTDALIMGAITRHYGPYEAAVQAVEAGADILLMPTDPEGTIEAIAEAIRTGRLDRDRITASVGRIWRAKQKVCHDLTIPPETCHAWEHSPPPPVQLAALATPAARATLTEILQASSQVRGQLPPVATSTAQTLILVDDVVNADWLHGAAGAIALPASLGYDVRLLDERLCRLPLAAIPLRSTLLQIFNRGNPFRGAAGLSDYAVECFHHLLTHGCLAGLVVYGSPYGFEQLRSDLPADLPYGFTYGQSPESQTVLLTQLLPSQQPVSQPQAFTN
ncbi:MAG: glycoside hydrolase family 3 N-terminal domain-containing protein [Leptolyngbyaceae cyanobacterium]